MKAPRPTRIIFSVFCMFTLMGATGCGKNSALISSKCKASSDQMGSMKVKAEDVPYTVYLDSTFAQLGDSVRQGIYRVTSGWNDEAQRLGKGRFFNLQEVDMPSAIRAFDGSIGSDISCRSDLGGQTAFYIVRTEDPNQWKNLVGQNTTTQGITLQCTSDQRIRAQIIFANTKVIPYPEQIASVIAHEQGHALGLQHSCASDMGDDHATSDYRSCSGLVVDHPYRLAMMYFQLAQVDPLLAASSRGRLVNPYIDSRFQGASGVNSGSTAEIKEDLRENDQIRTECLYGD